METRKLEKTPGKVVREAMETKGWTQTDLAYALGSTTAAVNQILNDKRSISHNMARALGVPTLAFFGSTDPTMFDFHGHEVLFAKVPCAPCSFFGRRRCPRGHFRCMLDLGEERAWAALLPLLSAGRLPLLSA